MRTFRCLLVLRVSICEYIVYPAQVLRNSAITPCMFLVFTMTWGPLLAFSAWGWVCSLLCNVQGHLTEPKQSPQMPILPMPRTTGTASFHVRFVEINNKQSKANKTKPNMLPIYKIGPVKTGIPG